MKRRRIVSFVVVLVMGILMFIGPNRGLPVANAQRPTPPLPLVAIHVSELTDALEAIPGMWYTTWHYFVMPESLKEMLRSDGTPFTVVTDADIMAGGLLHPDGAPKYPILISLTSEAIDDAEIAPLAAYVDAGGFLFAGSSSFTRYPNGSTRGNFALASELGLNMHTPNLYNWYDNSLFTRVSTHRLINHIPTGTLTWRMPRRSEEIPVGTSPTHTLHGTHFAWQVDNVDAQVLATGSSSSPLLATKSYGRGHFIYYGLMQPLMAFGGADPGMYSYLIFRNAIEWAFEAADLPIVKLSPWRYQYDTAFIVRHDFENYATSIQSIESIAQAEQAKGIAGEYYFCTGTVRPGSADTQLSETEKQATIESLQRAVNLYGTTLGSHNGGLSNPVNLTLLPTAYDYWHWGPDEALDTTPAGYADGKAYASASIAQSFQDLEDWLDGLDNGRPGCGATDNCPRLWTSPYFNSTRDDSYDLLEQLEVTTVGEQKLGPFPHWTVSTATEGKLFTHLTLPVSDWFVGTEIAQSLADHTETSMRATVDFYAGRGFLVNLYGHDDSDAYSSYVAALPQAWSTNSIGIYDWWVLRSPVVVTSAYSADGDEVSVTASVANVADPNTAIEFVIPFWNSGLIVNPEVLLDGLAADPADYRTTSYGVKVRVGTATTVEVHYDYPAGGIVRMGEINILNTDNGFNGNLLIAQQTSLPVDAIVQSLSFYVTQTTGQLRLGVYDDASGTPGALLAETDAFTPGLGWNTQSVQSPVLLPAGTYWLAFLPESDNLGCRLEATGTTRGGIYPFGPMPDPFLSSPLGDSVHWSFYATLTEDVPTAVSLIAFTATPTVRGIALSWETASEHDSLGFNLYRSNRYDGNYVRLNDTLIPCQALGQPVGATYGWLDENLEPGVAYYYRLEEVDVGGQRTPYGPVWAVPEAQEIWHIYLPTVGSP